MKRILALALALAALAMTGSALAEAFTPITVEGEDYRSNLDVCIASVNDLELGTDETFSFNAAVGARSEERGYREALPHVRSVLRGGRRDAVMDTVAVGTLGLLGDAADVALLESFSARGGSRLARPCAAAIERINGRKKK